MGYGRRGDDDLVVCCAFSINMMMMASISHLIGQKSLGLYHDRQGIDSFGLGNW